MIVVLRTDDVVLLQIEKLVPQSLQKLPVSPTISALSDGLQQQVERGSQGAKIVVGSDVELNALFAHVWNPFKTTRKQGATGL